jgi:Tfp pilus assembly protein FimT
MAKRSVRGVTAFELIIAVAIIGIMSAVAVPLFRNTIAQRRLSSSVQRVASDLRYAQSLAVSKGTLHRFHSAADPIVNQPGKYRLEESTDGGTNWSPLTGWWYALSTDYGSGATLQSIRDGAASPVTLYEVRFNSRGLAANPGSVTYPVTLTIATEAGTGTVRVMWAGTVRVP